MPACFHSLDDISAGHRIAHQHLPRLFSLSIFLDEPTTPGAPWWSPGFNRPCRWMARFSLPTCSFEDSSHYTRYFDLFIFTGISLFLSAHPILSRTFEIIRQMGFECYKTPSTKYRQHDGDEMSLARAEINNSQRCCCLLEAGEAESL